MDNPHGLPSEPNEVARPASRPVHGVRYYVSGPDYELEYLDAADRRMPRKYGPEYYTPEGIKRSALRPLQ